MTHDDVVTKLASAMKVIQSVSPPAFPPNAEVMTAVIEWPAGSPGAPPRAMIRTCG